jgi:hypothetical protein
MIPDQPTVYYVLSITVLGSFAAGHTAIAFQLAKRTRMSEAEETLEIAAAK